MISIQSDLHYHKFDLKFPFKTLWFIIFSFADIPQKTKHFRNISIY